MAFNMPNDKELERLFQVGAERYETKYDPEAWNRMEGLLVRRRRRGFFFLAFFIVGMALMIIFLAYMINHIANAEDVHKGEPITVTTEESNSNKSKDDIIIADESLGDRVIDPLSAKDMQADGTTGKELNDRSKTQLKIFKSKHLPNSFSTPDNPLKEFTSGPAEDIIVKANPSIINQNESSQLGREDFKRTSLPLSTADGIITLPRLFGLEVLEIRPLDIDLAYSGLRKPQPVEITRITRFNKFWDLGVIVGAETSRTQTNGFSSLDPTFGLAANYNFSKKLRVKFSTTYMKDSYIVGQGDYKPPKGYWKNGRAPEQTFAECNMIDVGLGLQYMFSETGKAGFFTGIGLSSNFMLNEEYYYMYDEFFDRWWAKHKTGSSTLLNSFEINFGYGRSISDRFHLSLVPYAKIPVRGVGHGDIMLGGMGVRLVLSWKTN